MKSGVTQVNVSEVNGTGGGGGGAFLRRECGYRRMNRGMPLPLDPGREECGGMVSGGGYYCPSVSERKNMQEEEEQMLTAQLLFSQILLTPYYPMDQNLVVSV